MTEVETSDVETLFLGESDPEDDGMTWDIRRDVPPEKDLWNPLTGHPELPRSWNVGWVEQVATLGKEEHQEDATASGCFCYG